MVTTIQAFPEVVFQKLPNIEFFMFYSIMSKSGKMVIQIVHIHHASTFKSNIFAIWVEKS